MTRLPGDRAARPGACPCCYDGATRTSTGKVLDWTCTVCDGTGLRPPPIAEYVLLDGESLQLYGPYQPPGSVRCESCGDLRPTVKHRERTGGPDGYLCDACDEDVSRAGAEPPQF